jgi:TonB family protein
MTVLVEAAIESSLVLLVALGVLTVLRGRSAALKHAVLASAVACAVTAPAIGRAVPAWQLPIAMAPLMTEAARPSMTPSGPRAGVREIGGPAMLSRAPEPWTLRVGTALGAVWMAGVASALLALAFGLGRLAALARRARPVPDGPWTETAAQIAHQYGIVRPIVLLLSEHPSLIVTWGLRRPRIVLPAAATGWPEERVRIVLYHELAHVRRGDWPILLGAEALRCVYWFNPLVWIACARLRHEAEQACDDEVITRGVDATAYASELVDIARDLTGGRPWMPAPAISRSSRFKRRVQAMLDTRRNRGPVTRRAYAAAAAVMIALTAAIVSAQTRFASLTGSIVDQMNGVMPGVTLVLTNAANESKYEVRTDSSGRYQFVGLPPGDYQFEAKLPGFMTFTGKLTISGADVQRDLTMELGTLQETITVATSRSAPTAPVPAAVTRASGPRPVRPPCGEAPEDGRQRVGGNVRAPMKIRDVRPIYPGYLAVQGVEGTVILKGRIGTSGLIEELDVISTPHPELATAALDAVRQWEFTETLLNCRPVPVTIGITVNFTLKP